MSTSLDPALIVELLQSLPVGLFIIRDATVLWCNDALSRMTGTPKERAVGESFVGLIAPEDRHLVVERYRQRMAGEHIPDTYEFSLLGEGGRRTPVSMVARTVDHDGGRYSVGVCVDGTAHARIASGLDPADARVLSAPVLRVAAGVLVVPLIGRFHAERASALEHDVLAATAAHAARALILDLTGLVDADRRVAGYIVRIAAAVRLLGARCLLAGLSPALAQALAGSDTALVGLQTAATLEDALVLAAG